VVGFFLTGFGGFFGMEGEILILFGINRRTTFFS
jgi:hypothetical protein